MDKAVTAYLRALVATAREVLGDGLTGAYTTGSVAMDAYDPGRSDVDVALVCSAPLDTAAKRGLVARLRHEALPCPARGLELVVYQDAVARSGTPDPGFEVELTTGARMAFRATLDPAGRPAADGLFWYGLDRSILHGTGLALLGPPAAEQFGDLAPADLRGLLVEALGWWVTLPPGDATDDAVLGACRSLVKLRHGVWLTKAAAGRRLVAEGEPAAVIEGALAARAGTGPPPDPGAARAFQLAALAELRAAAG